MFGYKEGKREEKKRKYLCLIGKERKNRKKSVYFLLICSHKIERERETKIMDRNIIIKHEESNMSDPTFLVEIFLFTSSQNDRNVKCGLI